MAEGAALGCTGLHCIIAFPVRHPMLPLGREMSKVGEYLRYRIERYRRYIPFPVSYLYLRNISRQLLLMVSVSKYLEDAAFHVSVS